MSVVEDNLPDGITLPTPAAPVANYVPCVRTGNLWSSPASCASGRTASSPTPRGKLGAEVSIEAGQAAARLCAINVLAQLRAALGDLDRVARCVRLGGFINAVPDFAALPPVMNGASDLMVVVLATRAGTPARPSASRSCPWTAPSRSRGCSRCDDRARLVVARPIAHRGLHDRRAGRSREHACGRRGGDRAAGSRSSATCRTRPMARRGVPRFHPRPADRAKGKVAERTAADPDAASRSTVAPTASRP